MVVITSDPKILQEWLQFKLMQSLDLSDLGADETLKVQDDTSLIAKEAFKRLSRDPRYPYFYPDEYDDLEKDDPEGATNEVIAWGLSQLPERLKG